MNRYAMDEKATQPEASVSIPMRAAQQDLPARARCGARRDHGGGGSRARRAGGCGPRRRNLLQPLRAAVRALRDDR